MNRSIDGAHGGAHGRRTAAWLALAWVIASACSATDPAPDRALPVHSELAPPAARAAAPASTTIDEILRAARQESRAEALLRTLSKDIGPRLTGTRAYDRSAEWARERFAELGLDARIEVFGHFPVGFERGVSRGRMVAPAEHPLEFLTPAWTGGTNGPRRGPAFLEPRDAQELEALKPRLAGAWIVRSDGRGREADGARVEGGTDFRTQLRDTLEAADIAGYIRGGSRSGLLVMGGNWRVDPHDLPKRVQIRLVSDQFQDLVARLERGETVELEFDIGNQFLQGPVPTQNVIADLVGRERPDEYVIVQAHLDTWDGAEGAQDNGTGVVTTLEAARLLAGARVRPRRTVRFLLFGGEEQGLLGSESYVKDHAHTLEKTSIVLNHDAGATYLRGLTTSYAMLADFERVFAPLASFDGARSFEVSESLGVENSGDSDHAPFLAAGVPAFFWEQSEEGYERVHHTQHDVLEEVDFDDVRHSVAVVATAAYGFAELDHLLDRTDMAPIARRRLGVLFDGARVRRVMRGKAEAAGWREGDVVVSLDGVPVTGEGVIVRRLQEGGSVKAFRLRRDGLDFDTTIDYSDDPAESERAARAARRAAFFAQRARN
ncbi:MAG: M20/M25/M40 family metallo-hydrolase [Planctomycetota bacterium]